MDTQSNQQGEGEGREGLPTLGVGGAGGGIDLGGGEGTVLLGGAAFVERFWDPFQRDKDIPEIPRSQRFANRPAMDEIFSEDINRDIGRRMRKL